MSKFYKSIDDYVTANGGDHAIKKILIANNGIGAIKGIRSIRKWCFETFGNEKMVVVQHLFLIGFFFFWNSYFFYYYFDSNRYNL